MNNKKSIFIGGIWHETNTFSSKKTYIKDFKSYQWLEGNNLLKKSINTNTEIGGFLEVFHKKNIDIKPSLFAAAVPSGIVSKTSFLKIEIFFVGLILVINFLKIIILKRLEAFV